MKECYSSHYGFFYHCSSLFAVGIHVAVECFFLSRPAEHRSNPLAGVPIFGCCAQATITKPFERFAKNGVQQVYPKVGLRLCHGKGGRLKFLQWECFQIHQ